MLFNSNIFRGLLAIAIAAPLYTFAETAAFRNGESIYGSAAVSASGQARTVDVAAAKKLNVEYGETVVFVNGGRRFAWTFDALDLQAVKLANIAPPGFEAGSLVVYVGKNKFSRN